MRFLALAAMVGASLGASISACDDGQARPPIAPVAVPTARESRDPPPAKPPELIDNSVGADSGTGDAGRDAGGPT